LTASRSVRVYSLNVPVPTDVARTASDFVDELPAARARPRGEHTLTVKRLGRDTATPYARLETRVRELLSDQPAFETRVTGIDLFPDPPAGPGPVVYLTVESPPLRALHRRLASAFDPVEGLEGDSYVPHVTVARGGSMERAEALAKRPIDPVTWDVTQLVFWDAERSQPVSRLSLPACGRA
jgi:2'-5' RNA ligase